MKRIERCAYGHIRAEKRKLLLSALCMVAIGVAIFILGLFINKFEKRNIFNCINHCINQTVGLLFKTFLLYHN